MDDLYDEYEASANCLSLSDPFIGLAISSARLPSPRKRGKMAMLDRPTCSTKSPRLTTS